MGFPFVGLIIFALVGLVALLSVSEWRRRKEVPHAGVIAVVGFLCVSAFVVVFVLTMTKVFRSAHLAKEMTDCRTNLSEVGKALALYLGDNNDRAPLASWNAGLTKHMDPRYLACPLLKPYGYTMNGMLIGTDTTKFTSPALTVAAFDGTGGKDSVGNESSIAYRHSETATFLYLDGHARAATRDTFKGLFIP